jgi:signal transduction histidine kinase
MLGPMFETLPRPLAYLARQLIVAVPLCSFVALFLGSAFNEPLGHMFVFSFSIGLTCQLLIEGGRRSVAWWLARTRPDSEPLHRGWPGWQWTLPVIVLGIAGGIQIGFAVAGWLLGIPASPPAFGNWRSWFIILSTCLIASVGVTSFFWSRGRLAAADAQTQRAKSAAAENQLKLLESQLEPHMLFNTLANLRVLIALDPPRAQAMLDRLIAFLRATLNASRVGTHALSAEFERLNDYLTLMQIRMGPRLAYALHMPDELRDTPLPPLLLQPLVENSISHGLEPKVEGGRIDVHAAREGAMLVLTVRDSGVGLSHDAATQGTRFGTQQVRDRLAALYGARATFCLDAAAGGGTEARITLPLHTDR